MRDFLGERRDAEFGLDLIGYVQPTLPDRAFKPALEPIEARSPLLVLSKEECALGKALYGFAERFIKAFSSPTNS